MINSDEVMGEIIAGLEAFCTCQHRRWQCCQCGCSVTMFSDILTDVLHEKCNQKKEIARLRQSLRDARELIERMAVYGPYTEEDAARKWLEENGDANP